MNASNVRSETFGRIAQIPVDGPVLGQPLVVSALELPGQGRRNVLIATTANNSVYALDADVLDHKPLWQRQFSRLPDGRPAASTGITSTAVIDKASSTLYVVTGFNDERRSYFLLHALDLRDGRDKNFGPVAIEGSVIIDGQRVVFAPTPQRPAVQRAALALAKDKVVVAFGGDFFEGWVFALNKDDLRKSGSAFCTTCASKVTTISQVDYQDEQCVQVGPAGGIWQSGRGPAVDAAGVIYFFSGNKQHVVKAGCRIPAAVNACTSCKSAEGCTCEGSRTNKVCGGPDACVVNRSRDGTSFDTNESLIALDASKGLRLAGWWRPANWNADGDDGLERNDLDLGGSGPLLLPGTTRLIGGGKQGVMYLLDIAMPVPPCAASISTTCLPEAVLQSFAIAPPPPAPNSYYRHILGGPVLWMRSEEHGGPRIYVWRENDYLRSYRITHHFVDCSTDEAAPTTSHHCASEAQGQEFVDQHPGAFLTLSANGEDASSAIVWASAYRVAQGQGRLMAFAAQPASSAPNTLRKLWDSDICEEDGIEAGSDFVPPTVANGKLFLATGANRIEVFGLIANKTCTQAVRPEAIGPMMQ